MAQIRLPTFGNAPITPDLLNRWIAQVNVQLASLEGRLSASDTKVASTATQLAADQRTRIDSISQKTSSIMSSLGALHVGSQSPGDLITSGIRVAVDHAFASITSLHGVRAPSSFLFSGTVNQNYAFFLRPQFAPGQVCRVVGGGIAVPNAAGSTLTLNVTLDGVTFFTLFTAITVSTSNMAWFYFVDVFAYNNGGVVTYAPIGIGVVQNGIAAINIVVMGYLTNTFTTGSFDKTTIGESYSAVTGVNSVTVTNAFDAQIIGSRQN